MLRQSSVRFLRLGVTAVLLSLAAGCSVFSGDDGRNDPVPLKPFDAGLSVQIGWRAPVGRGTSIGFAPMIVRDSVYAAAVDGAVGRYELATGAAIWTIKVDGKLSAGVGSDGTTTAVVTQDGMIVALDETGQVKWKSKAASEVSVPPVVGFGVVVVRSGDYRIQAFNAQTGERIWNVQRPGPALALRAPSRMIMTEGLVITGIPGGKMIAINAGSGDVQWEGIVATPKGSTDLERVNDVVGSPAIVGPLLCAVAYQGRITCFDVSAGGRPAWSKDYSSTVGLAIDARQAYAPNQSDVVTAFSLQNGNVAWKQDALQHRKLTSPGVLPQAVAFGDYDGFVHFLAPDDGRLVARITVGGGAVRAPVQATQQGILVQTGDSTLVMIVLN